MLQLPRLLGLHPILANSPDEEGLRPLHLAVLSGKTSAVKSLLDAGADLGGTDRSGRSALHWSVACRENEIVKLLLAREAAIDVRDVRGASPLHYAASLDKGEDLARQLLVHGGAQPGGVDKRGRTALHWSAGAGRTATVRLLLRLQPNLGLNTDSDGLTALHCSAARGQTNSLCSILSILPQLANARERGGATGLMYAAKGGHRGAISALLRHGGAVDARDLAGQTALHWALLGGHTRTASLLKENGADLRQRTTSKDSILHSAVKARNTEAVGWVVRFLFLLLPQLSLNYYSKLLLKNIIKNRPFYCLCVVQLHTHTSCKESSFPDKFHFRFPGMFRRACPG